MTEKILKMAQEKNASDIHLVPGYPVMFRCDGRLCTTEESVSTEAVEELLHTAFNKAQWRVLEKEGELETAITLLDAFRIRINAYRQQGSYAAAIRMLSLEVPKYAELEIPDSVLGFTKENRGLVFITGEAGSGRTTTAASLLKQIAEQQEKHIITIEHPVEYLLPHGKSLISQREIGTDTRSYAKALKAAVQQDADVIFISELPDADAVFEAISAAEAGVLVFALLQNGRTEDALRQLMDVFSADKREQMRIRLAEAFKGAAALQLLPGLDGNGQQMMFEVLLADKEIRMLIRENRLSLLTSVMENKKQTGMQTMDDTILSAYMKSMISAETAAAYALDQEQMRRRMKIYEI